MYTRLPEVVRAAEATLALCGVGEGDRVALWTDTARDGPLPTGFFAAAALRGARPLLLMGTETSEVQLTSPHPLALEVFRKSRLVVDLATQPWLYTEANAQTLRAGVPILQVLLPAADLVRLAPRQELAAEAKGLVDQLQGAREVRITSPEGTDLHIPCRSRRFVYQAGFVERPNHLYDSVGVCAVNLYPEAGAAEGTVIVDGPVSLYPHCFLPDRPLRFQIRNGAATEVEGGADARRVAHWMGSWRDPRSYAFAHTGFGLDPRANLSAPRPVDAESLRGGVNVAFGSSVFPQGGGDVAAPSHLDAILLNATFAVDGEPLVRDGEIVANGKGGA